MPADPFADAVQKYFRDKLADDGLLSFNPVPTPLSANSFLDSSGAYSSVRALEYFSRNIADRAAVFDRGVRQTRDGSLSDLLRFTILDRAQFFTNPSKADAIIAHDLANFERQLTEARRRLMPLAALGTLPVKYVPSEAIPENWADADASDLWTRYSQTIVGAAEPEPGNIEPSGGGVPISFRQFDTEAIKKLVQKHRLGTGLPGWVDPVPNYDLRLITMGTAQRELYMDDPVTPFNVGIVGGAGLLNTKPKHFGAFLDSGSASSDLISFANLVDVKKASFKPRKGAVPLGLEGLELPLSPILPKTALKTPPLLAQDLEPGSGPLNLDQAQSMLLKTALLHDGIRTVETSRKDRVDVSFEFLYVQIRRPWLFQPFLSDTNWYLPDLKRGAIFRAIDLNVETRVFDVVPEGVILVRNLRLRADFNDDDSAALGGAFAFGPFGLGRDATINGGELRTSGIQLLGYVDRPLPVLPPRSDPILVT